MGTNYYAEVLRPAICQCCGQKTEDEKETLHIGKSSGGWCFAVHVTENIPDWQSWKNYLKKNNSKIYDEYDKEISLNSLINIVENRSSKTEYNEKLFKENNHYSQYTSLERFLEVNQAEIGPNNLLRHKLNERCISHGDGTWDYIIGEFS